MSMGAMDLTYFLEALVLTAFLGIFAVPLLKKHKARQAIREEGPKSHRVKAGTPTMGGLFVLLAAALVLAWNRLIDVSVLFLILITFGHALLGFLDDFIKAEKKRNLGLTAKQKIAGQLVLSVAFCFGCLEYLHIPTAISLPFINMDMAIGWLYYPFVVVVIVGTSNAVNLTDGLDGLAAGCCVIAFCAYGLFCYMGGLNSIGAFALILAGCCAGFLLYNYHPAKIFMGDTGSLALGGALAGIAVVTRTELLLLFLGMVFVVEALSVILQVASFQLTGKRIFRMSPLHHHFELGGWSEVRVVWTFWMAELLAAGGTLFLLLS